MDINTEKIDEAILAMLYLTLHKDPKTLKRLRLG